MRAGHYRPVARSLGDIEALAAHHGVGHLVLVQPSVYGSDNTVMLRALQAAGGRHRGVAVVDPSISDRGLDALHAAGVRGVRFNLVSPTGHAGEASAIEADLTALAPRLRERGWHVQWYSPAARLPEVAQWQQRTGLRFVLDHVAGLPVARLGAGQVSVLAGAPAGAPTEAAEFTAAASAAWSAAQDLAAAGAWVKLSGWYRLGATAAGAGVLSPAPEGAFAPDPGLHDLVHRVIALFGPHTVWGSDWPHTSFHPDHLPPYDSTLAPLRATLSPDVLAATLRVQARALYLD